MEIYKLEDGVGTINFKYAILKGNEISLYTVKPKVRRIEDLVFNGTIKIDMSNKQLELFAEKIFLKFAWKKTWITDLKHEVAENSLNYGYRFIKDFLKGKKTAYVDGWYELKKREKVHIIMSNYFIIL